MSRPASPVRSREDDSGAFCKSCLVSMLMSCAAAFRPVLPSPQVLQHLERKCRRPGTCAGTSMPCPRLPIPVFPRGRNLHGDSWLGRQPLLSFCEERGGMDDGAKGGLGMRGAGFPNDDCCIRSAARYHFPGDILVQSGRFSPSIPSQPSSLRRPQPPHRDTDLPSAPRPRTRLTGPSPIGPAKPLPDRQSRRLIFPNATPTPLDGTSPRRPAPVFSRAPPWFSARQRRALTPVYTAISISLGRPGLAYPAFCMWGKTHSGTMGWWGFYSLLGNLSWAPGVLVGRSRILRTCSSFINALGPRAGETSRGDILPLHPFIFVVPSPHPPRVHLLPSSRHHDTSRQSHRHHARPRNAPRANTPRPPGRLASLRLRLHNPLLGLLQAFVRLAGQGRPGPGAPRHLRYR